jgi:DNA topoisomerase-6 subunit B
MAERTITKSSSAEYFSKNLQQVGFSSFTKATLTTIKESVDNSLDACEDAGILPEVRVDVQRVGTGSSKGADLIKVIVEDNGPGIAKDDVVKVFGEYLASSKFGRGRCSRGQQGIGISAVTTWAQLTHGTGAQVTTKTKSMRQALKCIVEVDIKHNEGTIRNSETIEWDRENGVRCEFVMDARVQLNGEGGLLTYLVGTTLVNPHLTLHYKFLEEDWVTIERVTNECPEIPEATSPHPHTLKLGEFLTHSHLFGKMSVKNWLKSGFSRINEPVFQELIKSGIPAKNLEKGVSALDDDALRAIYVALQNMKLMAPSTKSVMAIGESNMAKSITRLGDVDFFSVVSRKPAICDFKPVLMEVAIARKKTAEDGDNDSPVQILRFANRVPLQFDKASCAMVKAVESVNWKSYGLAQPKGSVPQGAYVFAISLVSPFIKFKNASKETVDASDELVEEIRRALIQCGQKLATHIRREAKMADVERKLQHIELYAPILVSGACRIVGANKAREQKALDGLAKILGRDASEAESELVEAHKKADSEHKRMKEKLGLDDDELPIDVANDTDTDAEDATPEEALKPKTGKASKAAKASKSTKAGKSAAADKPAKVGKKGQMSLLDEDDQPKKRKRA